MAKGCTLYMVKAVLNADTSDHVELAQQSNLRRWKLGQNPR